MNRKSISGSRLWSVLTAIICVTMVYSMVTFLPGNKLNAEPTVSVTSHCSTIYGPGYYRVTYRVEFSELLFDGTNTYDSYSVTVPYDGENVVYPSQPIGRSARVELDEENKTATLIITPIDLSDTRTVTFYLEGKNMTAPENISASVVTTGGPTPTPIPTATPTPRPTNTPTPIPTSTSTPIPTVTAIPTAIPNAEPSVEPSNEVAPFDEPNLPAETSPLPVETEVTVPIGVAVAEPNDSADKSNTETDQEDDEDLVISEESAYEEEGLEDDVISVPNDRGISESLVDSENEVEEEVTPTPKAELVSSVKPKNGGGFPWAVLFLVIIALVGCRTYQLVSTGKKGMDILIAFVPVDDIKARFAKKETPMMKLEDYYPQTSNLKSCRPIRSNTKAGIDESLKDED